MTDFETYRNSPEIESVKQFILQKAEKPLKPVWPFASFLIPWKKLGSLGMFYGLYKTLDKTYDSTEENRKRLLPKGQAGLKVAAKYLIKKLPGYQLKPLMEGSKLERQLSNTGQLSVQTLRQNTQNASTIERAVINKVLREKFADQQHVDYNDFRKAVQDELITYSRVPQTQFENYGIDRLKYDEPMDPAGLSIDGYKDIDRLNTFTFESPRVPIENNKHYTGNPLGHLRTFTTRDDPQTLYILESQSDLAQSGLIKKYADKLKNSEYIAQKQDQLSRKELALSELVKMVNTKQHYSGRPLYDYEVKQIQTYEIPQIKRQIVQLNNFLNLQEGIDQAQYLSDNYLRRQLQEALKYASENGQTKMRYPTSQTAARIEGYKQQAITRPTREKEIALRDQLDQMWKEYYDANEEDLRSKPFFSLNSIGRKNIPGYAKLQDELDQLRSIPDQYDYLPEHQTILRKYSEFPKLFKKLYHDQEVRIVTDSKGNTWYEVDVPNGYLQREWPFKHGGKIKKHLINK